MWFFNTQPTPEQLYRRDLQIQFISSKDVREAWRTTGVAMNLAAQEESASKAREMELKSIERAEVAKKKREDELTRSKPS